MFNKRRIINTTDGDTLKIDRFAPSIRLANVHVSGARRDNYVGAKKKLATLLKGKTATITPVATDVHGGTVVEIKVGNKSVNKVINNYLNKK